jgi:glycosyltransferase involved in cell wall biosynthesis
MASYGIEMGGHVSEEEVLRQMKLAVFLVMPTLCNENMPRVIVEAFACGTPVIGSNHGAVAEMIEHGRTGLLFAPGNPLDLAEQMRCAFSNPEKLVEMGRQARREYEAKYGCTRAYTVLRDIYEQAREDFQRTKGMVNP